MDQSWGWNSQATGNMPYGAQPPLPPNTQSFGNWNNNGMNQPTWSTPPNANMNWNTSGQWMGEDQSTAWNNQFWPNNQPQPNQPPQPSQPPLPPPQNIPQPPLPPEPSTDSAPVTDVANIPKPPPMKSSVKFDESKDPELVEFDKQFRTWADQFQKWKDENKNHPDKNALTTYEKTWTKWRDELLQKRTEIKQAKLAALEGGNSGGAADTQPKQQDNSSATPAPTVGAPSDQPPWGANQSQGWASMDGSQNNQLGPQGQGPQNWQNWGPQGPNGNQGWGPNGDPSNAPGWGLGMQQGNWAPGGPQGMGEPTNWGQNQGANWGPQGSQQWNASGPNKPWGPQGGFQGGSGPQGEIPDLQDGFQGGQQSGLGFEGGQGGSSSGQGGNQGYNEPSNAQGNEPPFDQQNQQQGGQMGGMGRQGGFQGHSGGPPGRFDGSQGGAGGQGFQEGPGGPQGGFRGNAGGPGGNFAGNKGGMPQGEPEGPQGDFQGRPQGGFQGPGDLQESEPESFRKNISKGFQGETPSFSSKSQETRSFYANKGGYSSGSSWDQENQRKSNQDSSRGPPNNDFEGPQTEKKEANQRNSRWSKPEPSFESKDNWGQPDSEPQSMQGPSTKRGFRSRGSNNQGPGNWASQRGRGMRKWGSSDVDNRDFDNQSSENARSQDRFDKESGNWGSKSSQKESEKEPAKWASRQQGRGSQGRNKWSEDSQSDNKGPEKWASGPQDQNKWSEDSQSGNKGPDKWASRQQGSNRWSEDSQSGNKGSERWASRQQDRGTQGPNRWSSDSQSDNKGPEKWASEPQGTNKWSADSQSGNRGPENWASRQQGPNKWSSDSQSGNKGPEKWASEPQGPNKWASESQSGNKGPGNNWSSDKSRPASEKFSLQDLCDNWNQSSNCSTDKSKQDQQGSMSSNWAKGPGGSSFDSGRGREGMSSEPGSGGRGPDAEGPLRQEALAEGPLRQEASAEDKSKEDDSSLPAQLQSRSTGNILAFFRQKAQEKSGIIPGLDLQKEEEAKRPPSPPKLEPSPPPQTRPPQPPPRNKKQPPNKNINYNTEAHGRLNIGPIGVSREDEDAWKPPNEWYDEEEDEEEEEQRSRDNRKRKCDDGNGRQRGAKASRQGRPDGFEGPPRGITMGPGNFGQGGPRMSFNRGTMRPPGPRMPSNMGSSGPIAPLMSLNVRPNCPPRGPNSFFEERGPAGSSVGAPRNEGIQPDKTDHQVHDGALNKPKDADDSDNEAMDVEELIGVPGRFMRPPKLVVIMRGIPGAGKSTVARMIKEREVENGGSAPRLLCLDDYFLVESEEAVTGHGGRKSRSLRYEFDSRQLESYRKALLKSFERHLADGLYTFILVDGVHAKTSDLSPLTDAAIAADFGVFVAEVTDVDVLTCAKRNVHGHSEAHVRKVASGWEKTPKHLTRLDVSAYVRDATEDHNQVEMEVCSPVPGVIEMTGEEEDVAERNDDDDDDEDKEETFKVIKEQLMKSKWDCNDHTQEETLNKLDGVRRDKLRTHEAKPSMEEWLQLSSEYDKRQAQPGGKKRVRWADMEERRRQSTARERGFVLGQTDWSRMTDPSFGSTALEQVRYIEPRNA